MITSPVETLCLDMPDWAPLEGLLGAKGCGAFLFMGAYKASSSETPIIAYKHRDTRRYLNLNAVGESFRYSNRDYEPIPNAVALDYVFS